MRAVAVSVCVVVALTGARRSHGGGCDDSSSSHSSSSSSGGYSGGSTHYDDDDDDYSSSTGGSGGTDATATASPTEDVKITSCVYDQSRGIVARVEATNTSSVTTYTYEFGVTFKDSDGAPVRTSASTIPYVSPDSTETLDVTATYLPGAGDSTSGVTCTLGDVTRTAE
ncbi:MULTISPECIES: hypothetical protein [unclassified Streptomyces]|uniref:hypothetical protein n=1 Tax=unclassified Streptomyces TaxID=2593676 RepID=UPI00236633A0|nr:MULTISPECIES: hypothetical protein [unclassified Streptomyces]MDF3145763.1 hypothetical protein [Streptomyces sp. T21Q-yed]WDF39023.1 hypothetical protein PBV52_20570 [Streptomyces sp. T12]